MQNRAAMTKPLPGATGPLQANRRQALMLLAFTGAGLPVATAQGVPDAPVASAAPIDVEGYPFERRVRLAQAELVLNGIGFRAVVWLKAYAAALYLTQRAGTPAQVLAVPGPKRLQLRMLIEVSAAEFVKAIDKGVARNATEAEMPALRERMLQFDALVAATGKVRKGDLVNLDFVPALGMSFVLNGVARGAPIPGEDFYAAVLRIFIGDKPVDTGLKAGLLGGRTG